MTEDKSGRAALRAAARNWIKLEKLDKLLTVPEWGDVQVAASGFAYIQVMLELPADVISDLHAASPRATVVDEEGAE